MTNKQLYDFLLDAQESLDEIISHLAKFEPSSTQEVLSHIYTLEDVVNAKIACLECDTLELAEWIRQNE